MPVPRPGLPRLLIPVPSAEAAMPMAAQAQRQGQVSAALPPAGGSMRQQGASRMRQRQQAPESGPSEEEEEEDGRGWRKAGDGGGGGGEWRRVEGGGWGLTLGMVWRREDWDVWEGRLQQGQQAPESGLPGGGFLKPHRMRTGARVVPPFSRMAANS